MTRTMILSAAAVLFTSTAPAQALAVQSGTEVTADNPDRANELRTQAEALFSQPKQWKKAARLLEKSAALRSAGDADTYTCLMLAGRIRAALGDYDGARHDIEKAAEHAAARGSVLEAAHAYLDAAHMAIREQQPDRVLELVARAELLASSPLLTAAQREDVTRRIAS